MKFLNQQGQALLVVVLAMVVALTVGLAVVSRSVTNLRNSQQEISSQQALSAAEAGVEQTIKSGVGTSGTVNISTQTTYQTTAQTIPAVNGADFLLNGTNKVSKDDAAYIWLTPYSPPPAQLFNDSDAWSGDLNIYWGSSPTVCDNSNAALEIAVIAGSRTTPTVTRYVYDPCDSRRASNNFYTPHAATKTISGITLNYVSVDPSNPTNPLHISHGFLVRVVPLYADSYIGVSKASGNQNLPSQGSTITSTGINGGNVQRKLEVFQGYPEVPAELFPFSLFWP
jgi:hypothetical protein